MSMKTYRVLSVLSIVLGLSISAGSEAALHDRGNGLIYDDVLNLTWSQDANLFKTQASFDSGLVSKIINTISSVNDSYGAHILSQSDFDSASGKMTWYGASAWVDYANFGGYSDWRLPSNPRIGYGFFNFNQSHFSNGDESGREQNYHHVLGQKANELTYMYGMELTNNNCPWCYFSPRNNVATYDGYGNIIASFTNFPSIYYGNSFWLKEEYVPYKDYPADYALSYGLYWRDLNVRLKNELGYAWLVRDGDVTAVPIPASFWFFATGIISFGVVSNKRLHSFLS